MPLKFRLFMLLDRACQYLSFRFIKFNLFGYAADECDEYVYAFTIVFDITKQFTHDFRIEFRRNNKDGGVGTGD